MLSTQCCLGLYTDIYKRRRITRPPHRPTSEAVSAHVRQVISELSSNERDMIGDVIESTRTGGNAHAVVDVSTALFLCSEGLLYEANTSPLRVCVPDRVHRLYAEMYGEKHATQNKECKQAGYSAQE